MRRWCCSEGWDGADGIITCQGRLTSSSKGGGVGLGAKDVHPAVLDLVTPLLSIVAPPLKPSNFSLLNTREKRDLEDAVNVCVGFMRSFARGTYG